MKHEISPNRSRLTIKVDAEEQAALRALPEDCNKGERISIHSDAAMIEFLEPLICNSELEWVRPEWCGDLTDAPILGITDPEEEAAHKFEAFHPVVRERWGWMSYQVRSLLQELRDHGEAILTNGTNALDQLNNTEKSVTLR